MISVIVPTWNEEDHLPATIAALRKNDSAHELLVVDASSTDRTQELARQSGANILLSHVRQRATQLNFGAEHATGEILLFLHADTILPSTALILIERSLRDPNVVGGAFARRFQSRSLFLTITCLLAEFRNRAIGWHLGDQGLFVRRSTFLKLGGFKIVDRFEDLDFSRRLGRAGRLVTLQPPVFSSARRFEKDGPVARTVRDFVLTLRYLIGREPTNVRMNVESHQR